MGIILIYRKADYHSEDFKTLNGKSVSQGKDFRIGYNQNFERSDMIVWINAESGGPVEESLSPKNRIEVKK